MDKLSDDLLLTLFGLLEVRDLVRISRVCRRWFKTVQDVTLWRRITIRAADFPIDRKFAHLIRSRCFQKVESLRIEGYLQRFRGKPKATHSVLTRSLLELLAEKVPNLRELIAADSSLENVNLNQFPQSLEVLGFPGSIFAMQFLNPLPARFRNLTNFDVSDSISISSLSAGTMDAIFRLKSLSSLKLRNCRKITEADLNRIPKELPNLRELDVSQNRNVTDSFAHFLYCDPLKKLEIFDISQTEISDVGVGTFTATKEKIPIQIIKLNGCAQISDRCFEFLSRLKGSLARVEASNTLCTLEGAKKYLFGSVIVFIGNNDSQGPSVNGNDNPQGPSVS